MTDIQTIIFLGRSGCGKGTQADLLMKGLAAKDPATPIFYLEAGRKFREFIDGGNYSNRLAKDLMNQGEPQPSFLAVWNWAHLLIENLTGREHLIIDGTPRLLDEARVFNTAVKFYQRQQPTIVHLNVSRAWSEQRLLARARFDDTTALINKRLDWFDHDVIPTLQYFQAQLAYRFLEINGEQTVEQVHADLMSALAKND